MTNPQTALDQLKAASDLAKGMMGGQARLKPYIQMLDFLNQELNRTYNLIQIKIQARETPYVDEAHLKELREAYTNGLEKFDDAIKKESHESPSPTA